MADTIKYIIRLTICIYALSLIGCTVGELESEYKLGNGYYILGDPPNNTLSKEDKKHKGSYDDIILGEIADFDFDNNFIILYRIATTNAKPYFSQQISLWKSQQGKDSLQYWIIEKESNKVLGPLNKAQFKEYRDKLKISPKLHIEEKMSL